MALCASIGLHWAALQTVAWTHMLVSYSQRTSLTAAVKMTFDGDHPCELCQLVKKGQSEGKKDDGVQTVLKWEAVLGAGITVPFLALRSWQYPAGIFSGATGTDVPRTPPPRA